VYPLKKMKNGHPKPSFSSPCFFVDGGEASSVTEIHPQDKGKCATGGQQGLVLYERVSAG
jgi:hypothetical protein